jgi:desulfoferrodoxin (superoxide reductase-like protein)
MKKWLSCVVFVCLSLGLIGVVAAPAHANKASVRIDAPASAKKGSEITIQVMVDHNGNSFGHYVEWVTVEVSGQEVQRWEYSAFDRPESDSFSREIRYTVGGPVEITAKAHCNLHGSAGAATVTVGVD